MREFTINTAGGVVLTFTPVANVPAINAVELIRSP
jgi:hypothetical protein